jgi:hypothetical protein
MGATTNWGEERRREEEREGHERREVYSTITKCIIQRRMNEEWRSYGRIQQCTAKNAYGDEEAAAESSRSDVDNLGLSLSIRHGGGFGGA